MTQRLEKGTPVRIRHDLAPNAAHKHGDGSSQGEVFALVEDGPFGPGDRFVINGKRLVLAEDSPPHYEVETSRGRMLVDAAYLEPCGDD